MGSHQGKTDAAAHATDASCVTHVLVAVFLQTSAPDIQFPLFYKDFLLHLMQRLFKTTVPYIIVTRYILPSNFTPGKTKSA